MDNIQWRDVISISPDHESGYLMEAEPEDFCDYEERLEMFLSDMEKTDKGQNMLRGIQEKYGSEPMKISLNHGRGTGFLYGELHLDILDEHYYAFFDQQTGEPHSYSFERFAFHELVHAADPEIKLGVKNDPKSCASAQREQFAVLETDQFARDHRPEFGVQGAYENVVGKKPDILRGSHGASGISILKRDNGTLREKFAERTEKGKELQDCTAGPGLEKANPGSPAEDPREPATIPVRPPM